MNIYFRHNIFDTTNRHNLGYNQNLWSNECLLLQIVKQLIPKQYGLKSHLLQSESEEQKPRHGSRGNGKITAIIDFTQNFSQFS